MEREYIRIKLDENGWNISRTADAARHRAHQPAQEDARARACRATARGTAPGLATSRREPHPADRLAGALGFSAVALGAFGAHGLRDRVSPAMLEIYRTGVLYHLVHALALLARGAGRRSAAPRAADRRGCSPPGIVIFSGSLYLLAITGVPWLGAVPLGGLLLLAAGRRSSSRALPPRYLSTAQSTAAVRGQHEGHQADAGDQLAMIVVSARLLDRRQLGAAIVDGLGQAIDVLVAREQGRVGRAEIGRHPAESARSDRSISRSASARSRRRPAMLAAMADAGWRRLATSCSSFDFAAAAAVRSDAALSRRSASWLSSRRDRLLQALLLGGQARVLVGELRRARVSDRAAVFRRRARCAPGLP